MLRKMMAIALVFAAAMCASCGGESGPQGPGPGSDAYFVSTDGDDTNPGTYDEPWRTIQKAADTVVAGDTVYVRGGTYEEQVTLTASGTEDDYIVFSAWRSEQPVIDGAAVSIGGADVSGLLQVIDADHIRIVGLTVRNAGPSDNAAGILLDGCAAVTVSSCNTCNTVSSGIAAWDCTAVEITGNDVELACNDGEQECITVAGTSIFTVSGNLVHDGGPGTIGGEGIDVKDGSYLGSVHGNSVYGMNRVGIYVDSWSKPTSMIDVYGNNVYDCASDGYALAAENGGLLFDVSVYDNVAADNLGSGLVVAGWGEPGAAHPMEDMLIINNTFFRNGSGTWGCGVSVENPEADYVTVRNNICSRNTTDQISTEAYGTDLVVDFNLIDGPTAVYGSSYQEGDPMFADTTCGNFHLTAGSPAIDNGTPDLAPPADYDGVPRPQGAGFDIGAFEYVP
jgi:hypothetical protein